MQEQNSTLHRDVSTGEYSRFMSPESSLSQTIPETRGHSLYIKQEYEEDGTVSDKQQVNTVQLHVNVKTEFESTPPHQYNIVQSIKVEVKHEDHSYDKDCGCDDCMVNRKFMESVKVEVKEEHSNDPDCGCDECLMDRQLNLDGVDTDRPVKRQRTDLFSEDDRGNDAKLHEEGEQNGDDQQDGGHVGFLKNDRVNEGVQMNMIQEYVYCDETNAQFQGDNRTDEIHQNQAFIENAVMKTGSDVVESRPKLIEMQHDHLSDIDYELEMLRYVFIKPIGNSQSGGQFWCDYPKCGKRFGPDEQQLLAHLKLHTKPFVCNFVGCLRRFIGLGALTQHKKSHNSANVLQCDLPGCVKRFRHIGPLNLHKRDHFDKDVFICEWGECDKVLFSVHGYGSHLLNHSDDGIPEHQLVCDWAQCARKFTTKFNLAIHRQMHTSQCNASITQDSHVATHRLTHTTNRPFACIMCGQEFTDSSQLKSHMRFYHPHACTWPGCSQAFCFPSQLKIHAQHHFNERPFVCDLPDCTKAFKSRAALSRHQHKNSNQHKEQAVQL